MSNTTEQIVSAISALELSNSNLKDYHKIISVTPIEELPPNDAMAHSKMLEQLLEEAKPNYLKVITIAKTINLTESSQTEIAQLKGAFQALQLKSMKLNAQLKAKSIIQSAVNTASELNQSLNQSNTVNEKTFPLELPKLKINTFFDNEKDPLAFYKFKESFNATVECCPNLTESYKLLLLKNSLKGEALSLILNQNSFSASWNLLEKQYLNKNKIIDLLLSEFTKLDSLATIKQISEFFTKLRYKIQELKSMGIDYEENTLGCVLLSKLIRQRLPTYIVQELARKTGTNYPSVKLILEHAESVLELRQQNQPSVPTTGTKPKITKIKHNYPSNSHKTNSSISPDKIAVHVNINKTCKFCSSNEHNTSYCTKYSNVHSRRNRAVLTGLCANCLGSNHKSSECKITDRLKCQMCQQVGHISPFCEDVNKNKSQPHVNVNKQK